MRRAITLGLLGLVVAASLGATGCGGGGASTQQAPKPAAGTQAEIDPLAPANAARDAASDENANTQQTNDALQDLGVGSDSDTQP